VFFQLIVEGKIGGTIFTGFNQAARPGKGTDLFVCFGRSGQKINLSPCFWKPNQALIVMSIHLQCSKKVVKGPP
jgi:hypothetical protein